MEIIESNLQYQKINIHTTGPLKNVATFPKLEYQCSFRVKRIIADNVYLLKSEGYAYTEDKVRTYVKSRYVIVEVVDGMVIKAFECGADRRHKEDVLPLLMQKIISA